MRRRKELVFVILSILTSCVAVHLNLWDPSSEDWKVKGIYVNHSALFNYIVGL